MKKSLILKSISGAGLVCLLTALAPLGVSAQWKQNTDNTWCYTENASKVTGWKYISNKWYYFNSDGTMNTGWVCVNGKWYFNNNSGAMQTGWVNVNGKWYYFDSTGKMQTGVLKIDGSIYYFNDSGVMQTGNVTINNVIYNFGTDGKLIGDSTLEYSKEYDNAGNLIKDNAGLNNSNENNNSSDKNESVSENNSSSQVISKLPALPTTYSTQTMQSGEEKILELMNEKRTAAGLKPLIMDNTLREVARYKSEHMIQNNYFSHNNPDGTTWQNWLKTIGYSYTAIAENIAYNSSSAEELFNQWWNSAGHKANMMNASYTKVGIGVIYGNNKYMGTQTFSN